MVEVKCVRFQYQRPGALRANFETMPFYRHGIRGLLRDHSGYAVWLKGNSGGDRCAWLLYSPVLEGDVADLLSSKLEDGGFFDVTATLVDGGDILERYSLRDPDLEVIGCLDLLDDLVLGSSRRIVAPGEQEWYDRFDWRRGFWHVLFEVRRKNLVFYGLTRASYAVPKQDAKGLLLELHDFESYMISHRRKEPPRLWHEYKDTWCLWEQLTKQQVDSNIQAETVLKDQPEWEPFLKELKGALQ